MPLDRIQKETLIDTLRKFIRENEIRDIKIVRGLNASQDDGLSIPSDGLTVHINGGAINAYSEITSVRRIENIWYGVKKDEDLWFVFSQVDGQPWRKLYGGFPTASAAAISIWRISDPSS